MSLAVHVIEVCDTSSADLLDTVLSPCFVWHRWSLSKDVFFSGPPSMASVFLLVPPYPNRLSGWPRKSSNFIFTTKMVFPKSLKFMNSGSDRCPYGYASFFQAPPKKNKTHTFQHPAMAGQLPAHRFWAKRCHFMSK